MSYQYTLDANQSPSEGVYSAVAECEDCSPLDLDPLGEVVNPEALDVLLSKDNEQIRIFFQCCGYEIAATPTEIQTQEPANE